jgi:imidazolonepropionase-like amidohydrolase
MGRFLFTGGRFLDPRQDELIEGVEVLVEDAVVREVSYGGSIRTAEAQRIDIGGRTLMPGLIDAHIHICLTEVNLKLMADMPLTLLSAKGSVAMRAMLERGFTTLRDTGGADWGMKAAVEQGLFVGPRLFIAGQPLSQTGGHGDFRSRTQGGWSCACCSGLSWASRVADGVPEVVKAARDELRKGADHIKIMVSGGVASQSDPLESRSTGSMRSRRRWTRRLGGVRMCARTRTALGRSNGRCGPACGRSSTAIWSMWRPRR